MFTYKYQNHGTLQQKLVMYCMVTHLIKNYKIFKNTSKIK